MMTKRKPSSRPAKLRGFVIAAPLKQELLDVQKMLGLTASKRQEAVASWSTRKRKDAESYSRREVATLLAGRRG